MISGTIEQDRKRSRYSGIRHISVPYDISHALQRDTDVPQGDCRTYMLWIDGVGAWQLCVGTTFVIGAPTFERQAADITLLANISRQHATICRRSNEWCLEPHQSTYISDREVQTQAVLSSGDEIRLAECVRLGFRLPSALSSSAVIDFESDHRPSHSVDGIILMSDHCLLGPRSDHHICCPNWRDQVVIYSLEGQLCCRSHADLTINDAPFSDSTVLKHGDVVAGEDLRFRVEQLE